MTFIRVMTYYCSYISKSFAPLKCIGQCNYLTVHFIYEVTFTTKSILSLQTFKQLYLAVCLIIYRFNQLSK